jgi:hypothetical protein
VRVPEAHHRIVAHGSCRRHATTLQWSCDQQRWSWARSEEGGGVWLAAKSVFWADWRESGECMHFAWLTGIVVTDGGEGVCGGDGWGWQDRLLQARAGMLRAYSHALACVESAIECADRRTGLPTMRRLPRSSISYALECFALIH